MVEPNKSDVTATTEYANKILDALNLTPDERQYAEDIGKVLAASAGKELSHAASKGYKLRPLAIAASLAYALVVADSAVRAFDAANKKSS